MCHFCISGIVGAGRAEWKRHSFPEERLLPNEALCEFAHVPTGGVLAISLIRPLIVTAHKRAECDFFCESRRRDYTAFPCNHPPTPGANGGLDCGDTMEGREDVDPVLYPHRSDEPRALTKAPFTSFRQINLEWEVEAGGGIHTSFLSSTWQEQWTKFGSNRLKSGAGTCR